MSAAKAIDRLANELAGQELDENPSLEQLLLAMILRLDERVTLLESEPSARRQAVADEDLEPQPPGNWVSIKQAIYLAGRSAAWIYKHRSKGAIAQHREGGHVLVNLDDVLNCANVRIDRTKKQ